MSSYIPEDCWPEILKRLPVKSLAQFRCVCRRWNALICSSSFIAHHLACSKSKPRLFINEIFCSEKNKCAISDSDSSSATTFTPHIMPDLCSYRLVGSAKGIICFCVLHDYSMIPIERCDIILWNPVINKYIKLPKTHTRSISAHVLSVAIGVKPSEEDDLRVVRISDLSPGGNLGSVVGAEIYSVRQGAWRVLHPNIPSCSFCCGFEVKSCVNGYVHWLAVDDAGSYMLIRFGFEEEGFNCITLPYVFADSHPYDFHVAAYCGRLAPLQQHYSRNSLWKIWTRGGNEEDSWSVIISIDPLDLGHNFINYGITHDGQILMFRKDYDKEDYAVLVLYNPTSRTCRQLDMQGPWGLVSACPFVESLVFMDGEGGAVSPCLL